MFSSRLLRHTTATCPPVSWEMSLNTGESVLLDSVTGVPHVLLVGS